MAKSKSERMQPVNRLAEKQEQQSALIYSKCMDKVTELENQLQKLYEYRDGYNQQMTNMSQQGVGSHRLQDTLLFMSNLNKSIETILTQIQQQKTVCKQKKQDWMVMHNKKRIYNKVTEKYFYEELAIKNKNEQKLMDEFNQSLFHRKKNNQQE